MNKAQKTVSLAKITRPMTRGIIQRKRLFRLLDKAAEKSVTWIFSPAGSGKSTLISSYLDSRKLHSIWYRCDEGDSDLATFFYYIGLAIKKAAPRYKRSLPLLTPEYLAGIPTFTRKYFEELYNRLLSHRSPSLVKKRIGGVIVLDNYQNVPVNAPFHDMIAKGFDSIPEGVHIVVISRSEPPSALVSLYANDKISILDYSAICFTFEEAKELVRGSIPKMGNRYIRVMHEKTEGWAAGMTLILERSRVKGRETDSSENFKYGRVFDYFAEEIFSKTEKGVQDFLLKTAFLPMLSVSLAEKLTGTDNAARILSELNRHHFFTEKLSGSGYGYQYHPLFRDFLLNWAKTNFAPDALADMQKKAAQLLEQAGMIEDAARLYCNTGDWDGLSRLIIHHARKLLMQGRSKTVEEWLAGIPSERADDDPWLLYWAGMCSFPVDMPRTRKYLEKAFELFKTTGNTTGIYLTWSGIVDTYAFGLDEWKRLDECIAVFEKLRKTFPSFSSKEIDLIVSSRMLISLTMRKTDRPKLVKKWLDHVSVLLQETPSIDIQIDTIFAMNVYYLWKGEYDKNAVLLERAEAEIRHHKPSPFAIIRIKLMKGIHYWITAEYDSALNTLSEGLAISDKSGVHVFDSLLWSFSAAAEMAPGNMERAGKALKNQMTSLLKMSNTLDIFFYYINSAWYAILKGNPSLAAENLETISVKVAQLGTPYYRALWNIGMAQVAFLQGLTKDAKIHIQAAHQISMEMKSHVMEWYSLLISSYFLLKEGKNKEGLLLLRRGLLLGKKHGYVHLEFYQPSVMKYLYAKALVEGIEQGYVKGLIRKLGLTPPASINPLSLDEGRMGGGIFMENWPYPVKIYTLGRFEIIRDDEPMRFSGRVQQKPLELLKAIVALGGREVTDIKLIELLWPETDGDKAAQSLKFTLHALRKLLGEEMVIHLKEGRLTLNHAHCIVDVWQLQRLLGKIDALPAENSDMSRLCKEAINLYKGGFLAGDEARSWTAPLRENLKIGILRTAASLCNYYEKSGEHDNMLKTCQKALEIDHLQEDFYQRLMFCYIKLGRRGDAVLTYRRCRNILSSELGVEPSAATEALLAQIK